MLGANSHCRSDLGQEALARGSSVHGRRGIIQHGTLISASQLECGLDRKKLLPSNSPETFAH